MAEDSRERTEVRPGIGRHVEGVVRAFAVDERRAAGQRAANVERIATGVRTEDADAVQGSRVQVEEVPAGRGIEDVCRCETGDRVVVNDRSRDRHAGEIVEGEPIVVASSSIDRERPENRVHIPTHTGDRIRRDQHRIVSALAQNSREATGARRLQVERRVSSACNERRVAVRTRRGDVERIRRWCRIHATGHSCIRIRRRVHNVDGARRQRRIEVHRFEADVVNCWEDTAIQRGPGQPIGVTAGVASIVEVDNVANRQRVAGRKRGGGAARTQRNRRSRIVGETAHRELSHDLAERVARRADVE